jgi:hydrogenase-4 component B
MLALTAGLALACFVRLFGMVFLGASRTAETHAKRDAPALMALPLFGLSIVSLGMAAGATGLVRLFREVPQTLALGSGAEVDSVHRVSLRGGGSFSPAVVAIAVLALAPIPWLLLRLVFGAQPAKRGPIWATGVAFRPGMQYSATSLSKPIRLFFRRILLPERQVHVEYHGASLLPRRVQYMGHVPAVIEEQIYLPLRRIAIWSAHRIRGVQQGSVELYLLYVFAALLVLLAVAR